MSILDIFMMPKPVNINGRSSSITNAFVDGIIPCVYPSEEQVRESLEILGLKAIDLRCAYCGDTATEWDHLRPLVKNKQPTGYISEIYNLIPSCGKCNQSKGNKDWKTWLLSNAKLSPRTRRITGLEEKIVRLEQYEKWKDIKPIHFETLVDEDLWIKHWNNLKRLHEMMREAQSLASQVKEQIEMKLHNN